MKSFSTFNKYDVHNYPALHTHQFVPHTVKMWHFWSKFVILTVENDINVAFLSISYQKWEFLLRNSLFNWKNENFEDIQTQPRPFQNRIDWAWHFRFENILTQKKFYLGKILYQKFNFSKSKKLRLKIYFDLKAF